MQGDVQESTERPTQTNPMNLLMPYLGLVNKMREHWNANKRRPKDVVPSDKIPLDVERCKSCGEWETACICEDEEEGAEENVS